MKYTDPTLQEISDLLGLDEWEKIGKPSYLEELRTILEYFKDIKYYKGARADLVKYIQFFETGGTENDMPYKDFFALAHKLELAGIISKNGFDRVETTINKHADDGVEKTVLEVGQKVEGIFNIK